MGGRYKFYATTAFGIAPLLAEELRALGAQKVAPGKAGVAFSGELAVAYRACLWSRVANSILLNIEEFPAQDAQDLYAGVSAIDWSEHLTADATLAVNAFCDKSEINHSQFVAQRIKDAIVDQFRTREGQRPSVDRIRPDLRINAYLYRNRLRLSIDLSGDSLHRRGYRQVDSGAPLKENLAAATLLFAGWPEIAARGGRLLDPMCGSGTLLIEAAMMAADIAPGLFREKFGFTHWQQHQANCWEDLRAEAEQRRTLGLSNLPAMTGCDIDLRALAAAEKNIVAADLQAHIRIEQDDIHQHNTSDFAETGLLISNPPYGVRMDDADGLARLYTSLGRALRSHAGWRGAVLTGNPTLAHRFRLPQEKSVALKNGALDCQLLLYAIPVSSAASTVPTAAGGAAIPIDAGMFANRLRKNLKSLRGWAKNAGVQCFRAYDADLPEFAAAIDLYPGCDGVMRVHLQEYAPPKTVNAARARQRLAAMRDATADVLACDVRQVYVKTRERQRGDEQYNKLARQREFHAVAEGDCELLINLRDYHDCGLFLDHRKVRQRIRKQVAGKRFLNLFAYTGAASVMAARGGASAVTTVDMSATYLDWAQQNFALNELVGEHYQFVRADCIEWLQTSRETGGYDMILLDPPTFSNSKRMDASWDVQRDHAILIEQAMHWLARDGLLLFSTNRRRFKLDASVASQLDCREISKQTVPRDFSRSPHIHRCWEIRSHRGG